MLSWLDSRDSVKLWVVAWCGASGGRWGVDGKWQAAGNHVLDLPPWTEQMQCIEIGVHLAMGLGEPAGNRFWIVTSYGIAKLVTKPAAESRLLCSRTWRGGTGRPKAGSEDRKEFPVLSSVQPPGTLIECNLQGGEWLLGSENREK